MAKSNQTSRNVNFTVTSKDTLCFYLKRKRSNSAGLCYHHEEFSSQQDPPPPFSPLYAMSHCFTSALSLTLIFISTSFCLCRTFKATCFSLTLSALLYTCRLHMSLHLIIPHSFLLHYFLMIPVGSLSPLHCPFTSFSSRHSISLSLSSFFNTLILAVCNFILSLVSCTLLLTPPISLFFLTWLHVNSHCSCLSHSSLLPPHLPFSWKLFLSCFFSSLLYVLNLHFLNCEFCYSLNFALLLRLISLSLLWYFWFWWYFSSKVWAVLRIKTLHFFTCHPLYWFWLIIILKKILHFQ